MIVADAGPLIIFARVQRLTLLHEVLGELVIPPAVAHELIVPGKPAIESVLWIRVMPLRDPTLVDRFPATLGRGEREAIALAQEHGALLLSDDRLPDALRKHMTFLWPAHWQSCSEQRLKDFFRA
ncbi:hypothetical protein HYR54_11740 [Candidatus Acetothermia bacterium]|nr:hypothetical protein [Candidatus Acetothermia bacterium]MBI3660109.1 hypothetical protein [Candidatus Acetothermia bacterium]